MTVSNSIYCFFFLSYFRSLLLSSHSDSSSSTLFLIHSLFLSLFPPSLLHPSIALRLPLSLSIYLSLYLFLSLNGSFFFTNLYKNHSFSKPVRPCFLIFFALSIFLSRSLNGSFFFTNLSKYFLLSIFYMLFLSLIL